MGEYFERDYFTFGGEPVFIFGGDFNYTRCPSGEWRDRMLKMRAAGLNTVTVYATDQEHGVYSASGRATIAAPELAFTKRREGELWRWETEIGPAMLDGLMELVLRSEYDGDCARAFLDGELISDHYYGRFQAWEFGLKDRLANTGRLRLEFGRTRRVDLRPVPVVTRLARHILALKRQRSYSTRYLRQNPPLKPPRRGNVRPSITQTWADVLTIFPDNGVEADF